MHKSTQPGSAILIIVLVLTAVAAWCLTTIKSASLSMEMALKRQEREQLYRMTEGVMRYGLWLCTQRFTTLSDRAAAGVTSIDLDVGTWKLEGAPTYTGKLYCALDEIKKDRAVGLTAFLHDAAQKPVFTITCQLAVQQEGAKGQEQVVFVIRHWSANSV